MAGVTPMKQFKTLILTQLLVIASLLLPWTTTVAQGVSGQRTLTVAPSSGKSTSTVKTFEKAGVITKLGYDKFTVNGKDFRFAPGALLNSKDSKRRRFSDFQLGDKIYFKGKILNDVNYVDIIYYEPPEPS
jgi:hypothetical protein